MKRILFGLFGTLFLGLAACQENSDPALWDGQDVPPERVSSPLVDLPYDIDAVDVAWFPCSLRPGANDGLAECSATPMPLYWQAPDGRTLSVYAKRLLADGESNKQLWLLAGGPGASGVISMSAFMRILKIMVPGLDIYTIDHRGVGESERLRCPDQEALESDGGKTITAAEMPVCIDYLNLTYGDRLQAHSTTNSAIDLGAYIHATQSEDKTVFVWGGSYGTVHAHRYLQIFPDQADAVVLEGVMPADWTMIDFDWLAHLTGVQFLQYCAADDFCSAKMGPRPVRKMRRALRKLDRGECPGIIADSEMFKATTMAFLYGYSMAGIIPPMVYRLDRCEPADVDAINNMMEIMWYMDDGSYDGGGSDVLRMNIQYSEGWEHPFYDNINLNLFFSMVEQRCLFCKKDLFLEYDAFQQWPKYTDTLYDNQWAQTDIPILMLQGVVDPATVFGKALAVAWNFSGPGQTFVPFPYGSHCIIGDTPYLSGDEFGDCGMNIFLEFLQDPHADLDLSCVSQTLPHNFVNDEMWSWFFFNTADYWENDVSAVRAAPGLSETAVHQLERMRHTIRQQFPEVWAKAQQKR